MPTARWMQPERGHLPGRGRNNGQGTWIIIGLAKGFKTRWRKHRDTLKDRSMDGQTRFSKFVWEQRDLGHNPTWKWKILERNVSDFNLITGTCRFCTREKYRIVREPSSATLNHRTVLFAYCKHKYANIIGDPPDYFFVFLSGWESCNSMY